MHHLRSQAARLEEHSHVRTIHAVGNDARPAVEVHGLGKTYPGGVEAVRGIDFQVAPGEVFGLLRPNSAGKSTTIGMLTTTIKPHQRVGAASPASTWSGTRSPLGRSAAWCSRNPFWTRR